jgi:ribosomal protein S18 acetylase RimI-like enzyme
MDNLYKEVYKFIDSSPSPVEWVTYVYEQPMSGDRNYWLALLDSNIVGFVDFKIIPFHQSLEQKFARIFDFFIRPSVQRCGCGTQLVRKVISSAKEQVGGHSYFSLRQGRGQKAEGRRQKVRGYIC